MVVSEHVGVVDRPISASIPVTPRRSFVRRRAGIDDGLMGVALLAGPANVVMQLALRPVAYGVMESRVESGRVDRHPIKRARTTFTYLAVATKGTDEQKLAYRRAVNKAHAQVFSTEDSPVEYHGMDKNLQMWVAACLYKGAVDVYRLFVGEMDDQTADRHYREGVTLGTTLQVSADMWPADREAFDRYWQQMLDQIRIDDKTREYLYPIAAARLRGLTLPGFLQRPMESFALFITTGFLPRRFREEMRLQWDIKRQRRFDQLFGVLRAMNNLLPSPVRQFPFNVLLKDLDWRIRTGRPLI
ncbi:MAG: oxygenase MpaB family protein [Mycobacterium sp.]